MKNKILDLIDFEKVDLLLEGFNKATGFVTAILDLDGNVLSKSGWRQICTEFHRINPETSKKCTISDTLLAGKMEAGEKYHFYKCLNGLIDVAVPIIIKGEHIANLFSGQFFFEEPDRNIFKKQANEFGFDEVKYFEALEKVPVVSKEKVLEAMDFLLNMTQLISETTFQKLEQIELNKNIRESENRFSKAFRSSPIAITITNQSSEKYIEVNESWCSIFGYTAEEAIGHTPIELTILDAETRQQIIYDLKTKGSLKNIELLLKNKSGEYLTILFSSENIELEGKTCIISTIIDVTDRTRVEEKFKAVFESANVGKSITLLNGEINVNQSFCDMLGYTREELKNKKWQDITPEDDIPGVHNNLEPLLKGEKDSARFEKRYICKNGKHIWADVSVSIRRDSRGEPLYFITTVIDITEQKRAELALNQSEDRLYRALENIPDVVVIYDNELKIQFINRATRKVTGRPESDFIGKREEEIWPQEVYQAYLPMLKESFNTGEVRSLDIELTFPNSDTRNLRITCVPLLDEKGVVKEIMGITNDFTDRMQVEKSLIESDKQYRSLFENMNAGFVLFEVVTDDLGTTVDLIISAANQGFSATTKLKHEDTIGKRLTQILPGIEKDEVDWIGTYAKVALTGEPIQFEQDSELLGNYFSISAFKAGPKKCGVTFIDITERKKAEIKLSESEARFRKLFEDGANGMVMAGKDLKFLMANRTFCQMTGYQEEELQQLTFADITHPDDRTKDIPNVKKMMAGEIDVYRTEKRYVKKDGQTIWGQLTVSPIYDSNNHFQYFVGIIVNVTERKKVELELVVSEERLRMATEQANVAVWEYDFNLNSMSRSANYDKLFGKEWQSNWDIYSFVNTIHPEDREYSNQIIQNSVAPSGPDNFHFDFKVVLPDQSIRWLKMNGRVIERNENGQGIRERGTLADITEQKQAELTLRESERHLRDSQQIAHLGSWQLDVATNQVIWTEELYHIYGFDPALPPPPNTEQMKLFTPASWERLAASLANTRETGIPFVLELETVKKDGSNGWLWMRGEVIKDSDGNTISLWGAAQDITERMRAEEKQAQTYELLTNLARLVPGVIYQYQLFPDGSSAFPYSSPGMYSIYEVTAEQVREDATPVFGRLHPDDANRVSNLILESARTLEEFYCEFRVILPEQGLRWRWSQAHPERTEDGGTLWHGIISDISDRKQAELSLRTYTERLKNLHVIDQAILKAIDSPETIAQEAILNVRDLLHCQYVSVGMFDFEKKEVRVRAASGDVDSMVKIGQVLPETLYGDLDNLKLNRLDIIEDIKNNITDPAIVKIYQVEGIRSIINAPIVSFAGLIGVLSIGWDTTRIINLEEQEIVSEVASQISIAFEQERLLQETKRHAEELEQKVLMRTAQLEDSNKELESFSYSVSHDLRAPLRHISGYVDLLNKKFRDTLTEKAGHYLDAISDSANQMGVLIDDLLQFSRIGRQELRKANMDMNAAVQEVLDELKMDTENRKISWIVAGLPPVIGDFSLLKQVWMNLLANAVKYTRYKDVAEIEIGFTREPNNWVFFVRDNGIGFDMQYAHKLFGVFQRLHSAAEYEGTGIGLANVQGIVHKHGGRVWADAQPDIGATFYFSIPDDTPR